VRLRGRVRSLLLLPGDATPWPPLPGPARTKGACANSPSRCSPASDAAGSSGADCEARLKTSNRFGAPWRTDARLWRDARTLRIFTPICRPPTQGPEAVEPDMRDLPLPAEWLAALARRGGALPTVAHWNPAFVGPWPIIFLSGAGRLIGRAIAAGPRLPAALQAEVWERIFRENLRNAPPSPV